MNIVQANFRYTEICLNKALEKPELYSFVIHDIRNQKDRTKVYVAVSDSEVKGFLVEYKDNGDTILDIRPFSFEAAEALLNYVKENYSKALVFIDISYEPLLDKVLKLESKYYFYSMSVKPEHFKPFTLPNCTLERVDCVPESVPEDWKYVRDRIEELLEGYLFKYKETPVAFGGYRVAEPEVYMLGSIYVDKKYRGRGYRKTITSLLVQKAFEKTRTACLWVSTENKPAIAVYKKLGFKIDSTVAWGSLGFKLVLKD
ncbi:MAG: hypothetical protein DRN04_08605 [Thermoprotei archaeon]|nr:MAG: hypothetical protein DRN04_08605 [Thermoprotei archaeon]